MNLFSVVFVLVVLLPFSLGTYQVISSSPSNNGGITYFLQLKPNSTGPFGSDIPHLKMNVIPYTESIVRVQFLDADSERWQVPDTVQLTPSKNIQPNFNVSVSKPGDPFGFTVTRLNDNQVIFDTMPSTTTKSLIYENQYLELVTQIAKDPYIYGLGERQGNLRLPYPKTYTIFARDAANPYLENVYGVHPVYMEMRNGSTHGVFLLNSNAMDIVLDQNTLTYKVIGGVLDFFFMVGPTPKNVIRQYLSIVGTAEIPPYWGLGWQQSRWGYYTLNETMNVVEQYKKNKIPLEVMYNDIDYMDGYRDFTTDPVRFPEAQMRTWIDSLHSNGQKYILIVDPGIKYDPQYPAFVRGLQMDLYVKNKDGKNLLGFVWPGNVYYPDFTHPLAYEYWATEFKNFYQKIPFDGIWIDMNEAANFCNGECPSLSPTLFKQALSNEKAIKPKNFSRFDPDNPPYKPENGGNELWWHTIYLSGKQHLSSVYNIHNLYGHHEGIVTRKAVDSILNKRSVVVSRSTFAGSGRYVNHWLGDNYASWDDLHWSIPGVINFGMYGIPYVGADICGFGGNTTQELCTRWIQLGAFYTFSRNHNAIGMISQEPYAFGPEVAKISADVILLKYSFLPYYYSLFYQAQITGDPVIRGLVYEFPSDPATWSLDTQMLIGPNLLITPVLLDQARVVTGYFPAARWFDIYSGSEIDATTGGMEVQLDAPINKINIHIRGGGIIPRQTPAMTTKESRLNPFELMVALDSNGNAAGELFVDDGESLETVQSQQFTHVAFSLQNQVLTIQPKVTAYQTVNTIETITIMGVSAAPRSVMVNGVSMPKTNWSFNKTVKSLTITNLNMSLLTTGTLNWFTADDK